MIDINWQLVLLHLTTMGSAYLIALPIAWDREQEERSAGLRTFPIVAVAACAFTLVGIDVFNDTQGESRILQGILAGIGFIGGGSILKNKDSVRGTATAAAIWAVGAIGIAVAYHRFEIALLLSFLTFVTLRYVAKFKREGAASAAVLEKKQRSYFSRFFFRKFQLISLSRKSSI